MIDGNDDLPKLRTTGWTVLGLLSFGQELSGYDVKKMADASLRLFYGAPSFSQIYAELRKLDQLGFANSREHTERLRGKRLYSITDHGRQALSRWLNESPAEPVALKHHVMLRTWLGHLGDLEALRELLQEQAALMEQTRRRAESDAAKASVEPSWAFAELTLRWAEDYYASERDRIQRMLNDLDEVSAKYHSTD